MRQIARLALQFGDTKIKTDEQRKMMVAEWMEAFGAHAPEHLHRAVSKALKTCRFWPSIAEITDHLREIRRDDLDAVERATRSRDFNPADGQFCREGRDVAQEIAYRAASIMRMKEEIRRDYQHANPDIATQNEPDTIKPASREIGISSLLAASCAVRRARGEVTCSVDCAKRRCQLKDH